MNQAYRIGDVVIVCRTGELKATQANGDLELIFKNGHGNYVGSAWLPKEFVMIESGDYMIAKSGTVTSARWNFLMEETDYTIIFSDNMAWMACVPESMVGQRASQMLREAEIELLNERGIRA